MRKLTWGNGRCGAGRRFLLAGATMASALALLAGLQPASALTLQEAVQITVETNPEIGEARANRTAIDHELEQARGLYLPQIDLEARVGPEWIGDESFDSGFVTGNGDEDWHVRRELSLILQQLIFDGFGTDAEVERQASRVDAAAFRVMERSEFIALDAIESYLNTIRQVELVGLVRDRQQTVQTLLNTVQQDFSAGRASIADVQQGQERVAAAERDVFDIETGFEDARVTFERIVGQPAGQLVMPGPAPNLPPDIDTAIRLALENNPTVQLGLADIDTAQAEYKAAESNFYPSVTLEASASTGGFTGDLFGDDDSSDIDDIDDEATTVNALLVARYNLFRGGIDSANVQEQVARIGETRERQERFQREAIELVRQTWTTLQSARRTLPSLEAQAAASEQVVQSYRDQFTIGQRTLLDLLDAENSLFNTRVDLVSLRYAELFAQYRMLASMGLLLESLGVAPPQEALANARYGAGLPAPRIETPGGQPIGRDSSPSNTWITEGFVAE